MTNKTKKTTKFNFQLKYYRTDATKVRLGEFNYGSSTDNAQPINVRVAEIIIHPNYTSEFFYNNIALIRLEHPVDFNMYIRPACLPKVSTIDANTYALMAGWPFKLYSSPRAMTTKQDKQIRKYGMRSISEEDCKTNFTKHTIKEMPNGIVETQICASIFIEKSGSHHVKILRPLEVSSFLLKKQIY